MKRIYRKYRRIEKVLKLSVKLESKGREEQKEEKGCQYNSKQYQTALVMVANENFKENIPYIHFSTPFLLTGFFLFTINDFSHSPYSSEGPSSYAIRCATAFCPVRISEVRKMICLSVVICMCTAASPDESGQDDSNADNAADNRLRFTIIDSD